MATDLLGYDKLVEGAMRSVVRGALAHAAKHGLPGGHHFYITFQTGADGVEIAESLHQQYPTEMTIVLQHQFWGLEVDADRFRIGLSFNKLPHELVIPFAAVTAFADPSVGFTLAFGVNQTGAAATDRVEAMPKRDSPQTAEADEAKPAEDAAKVITLDAFRKR